MNSLTGRKWSERVWLEEVKIWASLWGIYFHQTSRVSHSASWSPCKLYMNGTENLRAETSETMSPWINFSCSRVVLMVSFFHCNLKADKNRETPPFLKSIGPSVSQGHSMRKPRIGSITIPHEGRNLKCHQEITQGGWGQGMPSFIMSRGPTAITMT